MHVRDVIIAMAASTDSNYASQYRLGGTFAPTADYGMLSAAVEAAQQKNIPVKVGNVLSTDVFYHVDSEYATRWKNMGVLATEMECAALYMNAAYFGKRRLAYSRFQTTCLPVRNSLPKKERQHLPI